MKELKGDLIKTSVDIIVQQCNCLTIRPFGLSKSIKEKLNLCPYSKRVGIGSKNLAVKKDRDIPGTIIIDKVNVKTKINKSYPKYVAHLFSQFAQGKPKRYYQDIVGEHGYNDDHDQRLEWFKQCLDKLGNSMNKMSLKSIAFPKYIGCGLAGGDWTKYKQVIEDFDKKNDFKIMIIYL